MADDNTSGTAAGCGGMSLPRASRPASLQVLPWELLLKITRDLDYGSVLALRRLNRNFHAFLQPTAVATKEAIADFFLRAEHFKQHKGNLACFKCLRLLPRDDFGNSMRTGRRGKRASSKELRSGRCCWSCAAEARLYSPSDGVRKGLSLYYLCHRCGTFRLAIERCTEEACTKALMPARSPFERLADALQQRIFGMLPYQDAIQLAAVNRHFRAAVDPQACSIRSKFLFMKKMALEVKRRRPPANSHHGCYGCFSFKPATKFSKRHLEPIPGTVPRDRFRQFSRLCQSCVSHMYGTSWSEGSAVDRARFYSQVVCPLCHELRYDSQGPSCPGCKEYAVKNAEKMRRDKMIRKQRQERREAGTDGMLVVEAGVLAYLLAMDISDPAEADDSASVAQESFHGAAKASKIYLDAHVLGTCGQICDMPDDMSTSTSAAERSLYETLRGRQRPEPPSPRSRGGGLSKLMARELKEVFQHRISNVFSIASWRPKRHE